MAGPDIKITLQRFTESAARNEYNEPTSGWVELAKVWARMVDDPAPERESHGALEIAAGAVFRIRSNAITRALTPRDRLVLSDGVRVWNIQQVRNSETGRHRTVEVVAVMEGQGVI